MHSRCAATSAAPLDAGCNSPSETLCALVAESGSAEGDRRTLPALVFISHAWCVLCTAACPTLLPLAMASPAAAEHVTWQCPAELCWRPEWGDYPAEVFFFTRAASG